MTRSRMRLLLVVIFCGLAGVAGCSADEGDDAAAPVTSGTGGSITVEQLLERSADSQVAVRGLLHVDRRSARLCAAILESYPPQCGAPSVELVGVDLGAIDATTTAQGVTWKEGAVLNVHRRSDGRFDVIDAEAGFSMQVVLGIYSGVPDPTWTLTDEQANDLAAALASLARVDTSAPSGGLGYHGFTITSPDSMLVAYDGVVVSIDSDPPYSLADPDRTIERLLLEAARTHITATELAEVARALDEP